MHTEKLLPPSPADGTVETSTNSEAAFPIQFGPWRLHPKWSLLQHEPSGYEVDLQQMDTSEAMLDWILQVANKTWATAEDVGHLVRALNEALLNPQAYLCPFAIRTADGTGQGSRSASVYCRAAQLAPNLQIEQCGPDMNRIGEILRALKPKEDVLAQARREVEEESESK